MKKVIIIIALALATAVCANAQVRAEVALNSSALKFSSGSSEYTAEAGFGPGVKLFYQFLGNESWGLEAGLGYMGRAITTKQVDLSIFGNGQATMKVSSIEVPVHVLFNLRLGNVLAITPLIGVYADYHVAGKNMASVSTISTTTDPFEGSNGLKRFDVGGDDELMLTLFNKFTLGVGVQYGFMNMCKSNDVSIKPATVYFALGWKF